MTEIDVEMRQNSTSERRIQNAISREERKKDESIRTVRLHGAYKHCYYLHCYSSNAIGFLAISTQGYCETRVLRHEGIAKEILEPILGIRQIVEKSTNSSKFVAYDS